MVAISMTRDAMAMLCDVANRLSELGYLEGGPGSITPEGKRMVGSICALGMSPSVDEMVEAISVPLFDSGMPDAHRHAFMSLFRQFAAVLPFHHRRDGVA